MPASAIIISTLTKPRAKAIAPPATPPLPPRSLVASGGTWRSSVWQKLEHRPESVNILVATAITVAAVLALAGSARCNQIVIPYDARRPGDIPLAHCPAASEVRLAEVKSAVAGGR
jgi:hypothetical protein